MSKGHVLAVSKQLEYNLLADVMKTVYMSVFPEVRKRMRPRIFAAVQRRPVSTVSLISRVSMLLVRFTALDRLACQR